MIQKFTFYFRSICTLGGVGLRRVNGGERIRDRIIRRQLLKFLRFVLRTVIRVDHFWNSPSASHCGVSITGRKWQNKSTTLSFAATSVNKRRFSLLDRLWATKLLWNLCGNGSTPIYWVHTLVQSPAMSMFLGGP